MITLKYRLSYFIIVLILSSCATIISRKEYHLKVISKKPENISVKINDSVYITPVVIKVPRSNKDLIIHASYDTINKDFIVKKHLSPKFLYGNLLFMQACPVAYIVDLTNKKKFTYGKNIRLNLYDTVHIINNSGLLKFVNRFSYKKPEKSQFYIKLSLPEGNFYYLNKKNSYGNNFGFLGITCETGYYYNLKNHLSVGAGSLISFLVPFPAMVDYFGSYEDARGKFINIKNNHDFNRLTLGYGLNVTQYNYYKGYNGRYLDTTGTFDEDTTKYSYTESKLGLTLSATFKLTNKFQIGVNYLPAFINIKSLNKINYTHILYFDLIFNLDFRRKKK